MYAYWTRRQNLVASGSAPGFYSAYDDKMKRGTAKEKRRQGVFNPRSMEKVTQDIAKKWVKKVQSRGALGSTKEAA
eukprot:5302184-Pyramimonas_sp.AAC.1